MNALYYAVAAGIVMATASVVEKLGLSTTQPYAGLFVRSGAVVAFLGISALPFSRYADWSGFTPRAVVFLALGGLLAGLIAHWLYWQSLKATSPEYAVPIMVGVSQAAVVILSIAILRARVSAGQVCGIALVVLGISLIQLMKPAES
jgi:uncharacterized membrane protein